MGRARRQLRLYPGIMVHPAESCITFTQNITRNLTTNLHNHLSITTQKHMKTLYRLIFLLTLFILINQTNVLAQGCVAIRSTGGLCTMDEHPDSALKNGSWLFNSNTRYYKSFRHFIGKQDQLERLELHNNVINKVLSEDFGFTRIFNDRWSLAI